MRIVEFAQDHSELAIRPSRIVPIAMIGAVTGVVPIVVAFTFVMGLGRGTPATSE